MTQTNTTTVETLLTTKEAARIMGVSPRFLESRRIKGDGPPYIRLSSRCVRYDMGDVLAWKNEHKKTNTTN